MDKYINGKVFNMSLFCQDVIDRIYDREVILRSYYAEGTLVYLKLNDVCIEMTHFVDVKHNEKCEFLIVHDRLKNISTLKIDIQFEYINEFCFNYLFVSDGTILMKYQKCIDGSNHWDYFSVEN